MKTKRITTVIRSFLHSAWLLVGLASFALAACSDGCRDDMPDTLADGEVYIPLHINVPGTARTQARAVVDEEAVLAEGVQVLVFDTSDRYLYTAPVGIGAQESEDKGYTLYVELKQSKEERYLLILANHDKVSFAEGAYLTLAEVLDECRFAVDKENGYTAQTFPMWGKTAPTTIEKGTKLQNYKEHPDIDEYRDWDITMIGLERSVARVDVINEADETNFKLTSIRLYKSLDRGYIVPQGAVSSDVVSIPADAEPIEWVTYNLSEQNASQGEIYLPEVKTRLSDGTPKENVERCCLVIGGFYEEAEIESYYRVDFYTKQTDESTLTDVRRNYRYTFTIKNATGPGTEKPEDSIDQTDNGPSLGTSGDGGTLDMVVIVDTGPSLELLGDGGKFDQTLSDAPDPSLNDSNDGGKGDQTVSDSSDPSLKGSDEGGKNDQTVSGSSDPSLDGTSDGGKADQTVTGSVDPSLNGLNDGGKTELILKKNSTINQ